MVQLLLLIFSVASYLNFFFRCQAHHVILSGRVLTWEQEISGAMPAQEGYLLYLQIHCAKI